MAGEWKRLPLADAVDVISGGTPKTSVSEYWNGDIPWLAVADFNNGYRWVSSAEKSITERGLLESATTVLSRGDVILSARGTVGVVAQLAKPMAFNQSCYGIRGKKGVADTNFIYYALRHAVSGMKQVAHGGVFDTITRETFRIVEVNLPPLTEQRAIAYILGTLDDKIELNRRMSETLEAMARALFKAWFVDFEPVRAKMEGRWRRGETLPGLPAHLYDLFPDRLVDSELGEIPEGWGVKRAGDLFEVAIGKTPPRKEHQWFSTDPQDIPWMSIKDLGQSGVFISQVSEYLTPAAVERFRVRRIPDETVVLSFKLTVGRVAITDGEMLSNEAIAHFLPCEETFLGAAYLYCYLRQFDYESLGSTSSIATAVNSDSVRAIPILVPSEEAHEGFARATWASFLRLRALERESRTLAALRDTLLPKLISGELRVQDAATYLERVAA